MKIADGIQMLDIPANLMTGPGVVNPVLIWNENEAVLVDAGFPYQVPQFQEAFAKAGVPFERLSHIILTHSDTDHVGGLASILMASTQKIMVMCHALEKPYIQAELPPLRMAQMEAQLATLPEERRVQMAALCQSLKSNYQKMKATVDATLEDGEVLAYCGGLIVIYTPGHTPGHICLYHKPSKTLIAGDALSVENHTLVHSPWFSCLDRERYDNSLKKLTQYDIQSVVCYHGGLYDNEPNRRIAELTM